MISALASKYMYFIEDLLEEENKALEDFNCQGSKIERRQLYDDIKFMESETGWSIPLERIKQGKKSLLSLQRKGFQYSKSKN